MATRGLGKINQLFALAKGSLFTSTGSENQELPAGSDGQVLIADSTQAKGIKWGTSSAVASPIYPAFPDGRPLVPDSNDDEFDAVPINPAWTVVVSASGASYLYNSGYATSGLAAKLTALNGVIRIAKAYVPGSGDFQVTMKAHLPNDAQGHGVYIYLMNDAAGAAFANGVRFAVEPQNGTAMFNFSKVVSGSWTYNIVNAGGGPSNQTFQSTVILHVQRKLGAYYFYASADGLQWTTAATARTDLSFTVNSVTLGMEQWTGTPVAPNRHLLIDWVRFNWIDLT